jgi:polysaccharide pyruvyl transferase WcaK-like protein
MGTGAGAAPEPPSSKQRLKAATSNYPFLSWPLRVMFAALVRLPRALVRELLFFSSSLRLLRPFQLLIVCGGGQLTEAWGGPWGFPWTIFKWTLLARMLGVKCVFLNVGAGPLNRPLSKYFVRRALLSAQYVSFRDEQSETLVRGLGFSGRSEVFPDTVYGLGVANLRASRQGRRGRRPIVGLAPMAYWDPRVGRNADPAVYEALIRTLGLFGSWLIEQGYALSLFCSDIGVDPPSLRDLESVLPKQCPDSGPRTVTLPSVASTEDLLLAISSVDYVVTCRFHGVVFAHLMNKPVLALSHHPKVSVLMADLGLSQYCVDIKTRDVNVLKETFASLVTHEDEIKSRMAVRLALYRKQLGEQFDTLFPPEQAGESRTRDVRTA